MAGLAHLVDVVEVNTVISIIQSSQIHVVRFRAASESGDRVGGLTLRIMTLHWVWVEISDR